MIYDVVYSLLVLNEKFLFQQRVARAYYILNGYMSITAIVIIIVIIINLFQFGLKAVENEKAV